MSNESVSLNLKKEVLLPQRIVLPMSLSRRQGIDRQLIISKRQQSVPAGVLAWMRSDNRYQAWFDEAAPVNPSLLAEPSIAEAVAADGAGVKLEPWSEKMLAPALREYAKRHQVDLLASDKKDDVVAKLRAADLPEAKAPETDPVPTKGKE